MNDRIRVLIADDQPRARRGLKALLTTLPQIEQVREAVNGRESIRLIEESRPDLAIFDVHMPEMDGLETTRLVRTRWPEIKIIVLSMDDDSSSDAMAAGADAFLCKGEPPQALLDTLVTLTDPWVDQPTYAAREACACLRCTTPRKILDKESALR